MAQRISYNKAQELANAIEGATLRTFDDGTVAIYLHAVVPNGDKDAPMVEATPYNKNRVTLDEARQLIQEQHPFISGRMKGSWIEDNDEMIYVLESYDLVIAQLDSHGMFVRFDDSQIDTLKGRENGSQKSTMRRHMNLILDALGKAEVKEADVIAAKDFGL